MPTLTVGLIGNPNSGKSTVFNALTHGKQHIGNWPGVTVEQKSGFFTLDDYTVEIVDLPGIYSLTVSNIDGAIDQRIAIEYLISTKIDLIVNIIDTNNLERSLYLTTQLLELDFPIIILLNMADVSQRHGIKVDTSQLSKLTGCEVIKAVANKQRGINDLKESIIKSHKKINLSPVIYPEKIAKAISDLTSRINSNKQFWAMHLLENDIFAKQKASPDLINLATTYQQAISKNCNEDVDILIADARYGTIHQWVKQITTKIKHKITVTAYLDLIILNRIFGIPIFLAIMYLMFSFAIKIGGTFQDFFQIASNAIFVQGFNKLLTMWNFPEWLITILTSGIGKGINTTLTFIPVLAAMFFFLAILEGTGYIARAGFVIDRLMRVMGLPGKAFLPMLIGFGCNVPAILATRTLEAKRDRILTIIMSPFMSCGARLAIYAVFAAAFFPTGRQNIVFFLYLTGIIIAIFTGWVLRKTILPGKQSHLIMELPPYHIPKFRQILRQTWFRIQSFIYKGGQIIIPVCLLLSILNTIPSNNSTPLLTNVGQKITPIFKPMGIKQENWPAVVGLITGVMAKEIVVATLNTLYNQEVNIVKQPTYNLSNELKNAVISIPQNFKQSTSTFLVTSENIYGQMYKKFGTPISAVAFLLFVLLYCPCIPTIGVILQELNWRWALFSIIWSTGIAFSVATVFYQIMTFTEYPFYASTTIAIIVFIFILALIVMRQGGKKYYLNKKEQ